MDDDVTVKAVHRVIRILPINEEGTKETVKEARGISKELDAIGLRVLVSPAS